MATVTHKLADHDKPASCPHCGERQSYNEATPSKPLISKPYKVWDDKARRPVTKRDTYWHQHCRACGERMIWSVSFYPVAGNVSWRKVQ